jgi:hypothetical protein
MGYAHIPRLSAREVQRIDHRLRGGNIVGAQNPAAGSRQCNNGQTRQPAHNHLIFSNKNDTQRKNLSLRGNIPAHG